MCVHNVGEFSDNLLRQPVPFCMSSDHAFQGFRYISNLIAALVSSVLCNLNLSRFEHHHTSASAACLVSFDVPIRLELPQAMSRILPAVRIHRRPEQNQCCIFVPLVRKPTFDAPVAILMSVSLLLDPFGLCRAAPSYVLMVLVAGLRELPHRFEHVGEEPSADLMGEVLSSPLFRDDSREPCCQFPCSRTSVQV